MVDEYQLSDRMLQRLEIASLEYEVVISNIPRISNRPFRRRHYALGEPVGASFLHFLPEKIYYVYDLVEDQSRQLVDAFINTDEPIYRDIETGEEQIVLNDTFKTIILETTEAYLDETNTKNPRVLRLFENLKNEVSVSNMRSFTRLLKYLGPLRDEPKPVYPLAGATDPNKTGWILWG